MPSQTTHKEYVFIPDGCAVLAKKANESSFTDLGVVMGNCEAALSWAETKREYANAEADMGVKDMIIEGSFELGNLNPDNIDRIGMGIFTKETIAAAPNTAIPVQDISAGWEDNVKYELVMYNSATGNVKIHMATKPIITTVKLAPAGVDETLTEIGAAASGDYMIVKDSNSYSGWSIIFNSAGMSVGSPKTLPIRITYGTNIPIASTTLFAGSNSVTLDGYLLQFKHTDSAALNRILDLFNVYTKSGGFKFSFKPVTDTGIETMPISFTAKLDTTRIDGKQLMAWTYETGAA